jgi:hypothetical protein
MIASQPQQAPSTLAVLRAVRDWSHGEAPGSTDPVTLFCQRCGVRLSEAVIAFHRAWTAGLIGFTGSFARSWVTPLGAAALAE